MHAVYQTRNLADRTRRPFLLLPFVIWTFAGLAFAQSDGDPQRPNVLFIAVDDLADWCGCLRGHPDAQTPNIDRLAARGVLFTNAHCVSPICGPSRAAVLTGMRPETTGVYTNQGTYSDYVPEAVGLPLHFKNSGYRVLGAGKINHGLGMMNPSLWHDYGPDCGIVGTPFTNEEMLSAGLENGRTRTIRRGRLNCTLPMNGGLSLIDRPEMTWNTFEWGPLDLPDEDFPDGQIAAWAVEQLQKELTEPLFLAVGFYKPHQPFIVPRKYFEMFDPRRTALPPSIAGDLNDVPRAGKELAHANWSAGTHKTVTEHNQWREGVAAYLATIAFADAQVGKVLDALDRSPHANSTWVVLWSDHGWTLGEKEHWGKYDPWQGSLRVPLIIVPPKDATPDGFQPGSRCDALVSLLDLYPTLIDACRLPERAELEGRSLLPLISDPDRKWSEAVSASIGRGTHAVISKDWKYIHYFDGSEELYDLRVDPEEWFNLASRTELSGTKQRLANQIPTDVRFRQLARWKSYKCVIPAEGKPLLFDFRATFGISEHSDIAHEQPHTVDAILAYLREHRRDERHVSIPAVAIPVRAVETGNTK